MKLRTLGICGGGGVILHPFRDQLISNIEIRSIFHTPKQIQWRLNFNVPFEKDLSIRFSKNLVDVIIGAPDCGHSSILAYSRAKKLSDPKENISLTFFMGSISYYKPKVFMMENLLKMAEVVDLEASFPDYDLKVFNEAVSVWGNSQFSRVRLVVVGIRKDLMISKVLIDLPDLTNHHYKNVNELFEGLGKMNGTHGHIREPDDYSIPLYIDGKRKITVQEAREIWRTRFKDHSRWEVEDQKMKNQPGVYRIFGDGYPLTVRKQNRQFGPDGNMLTPREIARIQGVPDSFKLWYDPLQSLYCINKARVTCAKTPPYEIGQWFKGICDKLEKYL